MMSDDGINLSSIGASLRAARESQSLSVEKISSQLHLSEKQIQALEQDEFQSFGSAMLTRGFIKNYARLLSLDPEPLLEAHRKNTPQDQIQSISYTAEKIVSSKAPNLKKSKVLMMSILLLLILTGLIVYRITSHSTNSGENGTALEASTHAVDANVQVSGDPMPEAALPAAERAAEGNVTTVTEIPLPADPEVTKPQLQKNEVNKGADKVVDQAPVAKSETTKTESLNANFVKAKLVLTGPSWISVQDKTGKTVFSKLAKAGTDEFVEGAPPLKFHIGNVGATQIIFNGQPVDLTSNTFNNMARITLGDR